MLSEFLLPLIVLVLTNIVSIGGWIQTSRASKRKSNADSKISEFDATEKIIDIYKQMAEDIINNYERRITNLENEIKELLKLKCEKDKCENRLQ